MVPLGAAGVGMSDVSLVGQAGDAGVDVSVAAVTPDYFDTIQTRLVVGREFSSDDVEGGDRVAIVNETLWRALERAPPRVGDQLAFGQQRQRVVGVARAFPDTSLREPARPVVYVPLAQTVGGSFAWGRLTVLARAAAGEAATLLPAIRQVVWSLGHDLVLDEAATMDERIGAALRPEREAALLYGLLALVALVVATAGAFAVVAYAVAHRTREIGIRMALGATGADVQRLVVRQALTPTLIGTGIGAGVAVVVTGLLDAMVYGVTPLDPGAFLVAGVMLIGGVVLSAYLPSRRAVRVDPVVALRAE
jgi:predicted lysophospholipase L1 biosynthesis ABC-type transport system permease subunit